MKKKQQQQFKKSKIILLFLTAESKQQQNTITLSSFEIYLLFSLIIQYNLSCHLVLINRLSKKHILFFFRVVSKEKNNLS